MSEQREGVRASGASAEGASGEGQQTQDEGLVAEQESAAAMDADVPQPPDADRTTEGQPS